MGSLKQIVWFLGRVLPWLPRFQGNRLHNPQEPWNRQTVPSTGHAMREEILVSNGDGNPSSLKLPRERLGYVPCWVFVTLAAYLHTHMLYVPPNLPQDWSLAWKG